MVKIELLACLTLKTNNKIQTVQMQPDPNGELCVYFAI